MIEKLLNFNKLKPKEKFLVVGLVVAIAISAYFNIIYKPLSRSIFRYKFQTKKAQSRLTGLQEKLPQLDKQRQNIHFLSSECQRMLDEIGQIESTLPSKRSVSDLLTELVGLGKDLKMGSVRQKLEEGAEYSSIYIELKFNAPYINTINYLKKVESISPFLLIKELDITEEKTKHSMGGPTARLILSSLLGEISTAEMIRAAESKPLAISRNIFVSKAKPVVRTKKIDLKLEGITFNSKSPTAIVNGEVVRIGAEIDNYIVKDIRFDAVVFADGPDEYIVNMER